MTFPEKLAQHTTIFIDTAPIIYYIEAILNLGHLQKMSSMRFNPEH